MLGLGLANGAVQGITGLIGAKKQFQYNKQLMSLQNQYNIDMWRMNNEYNTPTAQMQRFQDAGLNPNLIYGQGNAGNSASAPVQGVPEPPAINEAMQNFAKASNVLNILNQVEELKARKLDNIKRGLANDKMIAYKDYYAGNAFQEWLIKQAQAHYLTYKGYDAEARYRGLVPETSLDYAKDAAAYYRKQYQLNLQYRNLNNQVLNLNLPYLRTRNAWQPWQYGVGMAGDVIKDIVGIRGMFKPGTQVTKTFNRNYNGNAYNSHYNNKYYY